MSKCIVSCISNGHFTSTAIHVPCMLMNDICCLCWLDYCCITIPGFKIVIRSTRSCLLGDFQIVHIGSVLLIMWCVRLGNHLTLLFTLAGKTSPRCYVWRLMYILTYRRKMLTSAPTLAAYGDIRKLDHYEQLCEKLADKLAK